MTPVYLSPNLDQIELIQSALLAQGIETSFLTKKSTKKSTQKSIDTDAKKNHEGMHELWLKRQADRPRAKVIITQQEFKLLRRDMKNLPIRDNRVTQPVDIQLLRSEIETAMGQTQPQRQAPRKDYFIPKNLIHAFERLGAILGLAEPEMELEKFYNIQKPWDGDKLMQSVADLKKVTRQVKV